MCSIIKVEVEGETLHFQGEDDIDAQCKLDLWIEREVISRAPKEKRGNISKFHVLTERKKFLSKSNSMNILKERGYPQSF
ncbi:divergent serine/threonine protein kinase [Cannes 8 virus]|nr:divergent serine/threonine protein kinase [Cannes 8 virus]